MSTGRVERHVDHTYFFERAGLRTYEGRRLGKKGIMHPMFAQLYLQPDASEDEQDERHRASRSRRLRSARTLTRAAARDRDPRAATRAR